MDDRKANAMQLAWCDEMARRFDQAEADDTHALVITGRPGFFSAGLDLKVLPGLGLDEVRRTTDRFVATMRRAFLFPKPIVAASTGHAIAGGLMLYLAADIRLAARLQDSRYGLNEATTGIPLLGGTAGICQYSIPKRHHTEMILHGRMLSAEQTLARGVTHELVEPQGLERRALERAAELRDLSLDAYRINKLILRRRAFDEAVEIAGALMDQVELRNVFEDIKR
jgi:enoyl-CoA hydratase